MPIDPLMTQSLLTYLDHFDQKNVLVIGDIMLDRFIYGEAGRISSEGPVPVLTATRESFMLGGAGNALSNLHGLGVTPSFIGLLGDDIQGQTVKNIITDLSPLYDGTIVLTDWNTTVKTRFLAQNQHLLKVDEENRRPISELAEQKIIEHIKKAVPDMDAIILSDYGQGVVTEAVAQTAVTLGNKQDIPVLIDPRGFDYTKYKGARVITPNRKELSEATENKALNTDTDIEKASLSLIEKANLDAVIATRSQDGMSIIQKEKVPVHLPTLALEVFDVSGAGDTVISVIATALAAGADLVEAANLANIAGGIVVAKVGTAPILQKELRDALSSNTSQTNLSPLCTLDDAKEKIEVWKKQGLKTGFTNGCFDILHSGHVRYLNEAKLRCDRLIVALNHDQSVKLLKGETRPVHDEISRATVLGALRSVDMVVFFGATEMGKDNTPCALIEALKPDLYFKGGDYKDVDLREARVTKAYGGDVEFLSLFEGHSTTSSIEKMKTDPAKKAG